MELVYDVVILGAGAAGLAAAEVARSEKSALVLEARDRIGSLPVVDGAGQVIGIVTETDIRKDFAASAQSQ